MEQLYYLCFSINKLPDLTLTKYSVFDGSSVENIMDKHAVFLRQLHRLGYTSHVYFHLLYYYNPNENIPKGHHLSVIFYATAKDKKDLNGIREFLTTSVLSTYYDFYCYEIARDFKIEKKVLSDGNTTTILKLKNISGDMKEYALGKTGVENINNARKEISEGRRSHVVCEIASDADVILSFNKMPIDEQGKIELEKKFTYGAFLTKKDYSLPAQNRLNTDEAGEVNLYSIMEWEPCENGRLYNVLKLMEGYNKSAVLRIDIFPVEHTQAIRQRLPYTETRRRISDRVQGKDDNSENIIRSWDKYLNNLMKFPQFLTNVVAFADSNDVAVMLADSVAAEAVESGTYLIETMCSENGFSMYEGDAEILHAQKENGNYVAPFLSLYTLEEIRPMFSFPILYPGESIECQKETDPTQFSGELEIDEKTGEVHEAISLGVSSMGYDVVFPIKLFKKHAFIAGVPGSGKTNTMEYLVTTLWRDTYQKIPFLVLEPAKQEYRALAMISGMEELCVFSPGADTYFPLHINPFQFPVGLTLAEHIANLNAVFAGAFELIPPSPFLIDACIEKVYLDKGWNINERNSGRKEYPTMQELYDSLKVAVEESGYEGESKANIRSVMEVRIGSLLRREIGNVYNVRESSLKPEDWLNCPAIIELEALGEGPANFMSLLISTLIREVLKIKKTSAEARVLEKERDKHLRASIPAEKLKNISEDTVLKPEIEHIIFYEEAHNLVGPTTESPVGGSVDPKISATKYLVKMLAEVRALNEGIVIADQLPTAMAPEVLKNTGLKLGHRITAQDDRGLLGSTMSASADQLEEQGIFVTGQALIFYENLLKPYKMRVSEWEKKLSSEAKKAPTNDELFEHLKDNATYRVLLKRSAEIMEEKIKIEFDLLGNQAKILKNKISRKNAALINEVNNLEILKSKLEGLSEKEDIAKTKKHIAEIKFAYEEIKKEFRGVLSRELKKLCWEFDNQYYAYMTLSGKYYIYSNDMYMHTIRHFLSLFDIIGYLNDIPQLKSILLEETKDVIDDIEYYVDIKMQGNPALLENHPDYDKTLVEAGNYICNQISAQKDIYCKKIRKILENKDEIEENIKKVCEEFVADFWRYNQMAKKYTVIYKALADYILGIFRSFSGIHGMERSVFLKATKDMLVEFRKIVDYRNRNAEAILSSDRHYDEIWCNCNIIVILELSGQFDYFHRLRIQKLGNVNESNIDMEFFTELCKNYNILFRKYYYVGISSYDFQYILVQHYNRFLEDVINIGKVVLPLLFKYSTNNWIVCNGIMNSLVSDKRTTETTKKEWSKLAKRMLQLFKICEKSMQTD